MMQNPKLKHDEGIITRGDHSSFNWMKPLEYTQKYRENTQNNYVVEAEFST